jgi:hypothetical protein
METPPEEILDDNIGQLEDIMFVHNKNYPGAFCNIQGYVFYNIQNA